MASSTITLFLAGDVMTGRGVDQILPHPGAAELREGYIRDARDYVALAEAVSGPIPRPVDPAWPWGEALAIIGEAEPDVRVVNLETSITGDGDFAPDKGIHYRMHPDNIGCLTAAGLDVCVLANNHVLDFGIAGLTETLEVLHAAGLRTAGAGRNAAQAWRPAQVDAGQGGCWCSPPGWPPAAFRLRTPRAPTFPGWPFCRTCPGTPPRGSWTRSARQARRRPGRGLAALGHQLGLRGSARARPLRPLAGRRRDRRGARALVPPSASARDLPWPAHPLRLRRPDQRLRGNRRSPAVPRRRAAVYFATLDARSRELRGLRLVPVRAFGCAWSAPPRTTASGSIASSVTPAAVSVPGSAWPVTAACLSVCRKAAGQSVRHRPRPAPDHHSRCPVRCSTVVPALPDRRQDRDHGTREARCSRRSMRLPPATASPRH